VNHSKRSIVLVMTALAAVLIVGGCSKKAAPAAPPVSSAPPPSAQPSASLSVSPDSIPSGGSATLSWSTQNATNVNIDGVGAVATSGSQAVSPTSSTTYHLTAQGPGGTADASARLAVTEPAPTEAAAPETPAPSPGEADLFARNEKDIYFDYDKSDLRSDAATAIAADATFLAAHTSMNFTIEGHCDERGSTEYNLALGQSRAETARKYLVEHGVDAGRIKTISYGKEKPFCTEQDEECWQSNRRDHFVYGQE